MWKTGAGEWGIFAEYTIYESGCPKMRKIKAFTRHTKRKCLWDHIFTVAIRVVQFSFYVSLTVNNHKESGD